MRIHSRRGFSLVELLIAMVVMAVVLAGTMNFFMGQSRTFRKATTDMVLLQNARFATDLLNEHIRSVGANMTVGQPAIIFASANTFAFDADYATNIANDINAIYYEPNAKTSEVQALTPAQAVAIPNSSLTFPAATYEESPGVMSPAEAIVFWFAPDTETTRPDDYVLMRRANGAQPEVVVRNVLADSTQPFFRYTYLAIDAAENQTIDTVAAAKLPMDYTKDTLLTLNRMRSVMVSFIVTNGLADTAERTRPVSVIVQLPNISQRALQTCGAPPLSAGTPVASPYDVVTHSITVTWTASPDENGGEHDVVRYAVQRRSSAPSDLQWQPVFSIPAGGLSPYTVTDPNLVDDGRTYWYAVMAQDCTPAFSTNVSSNGSTTP